MPYSAAALIAVIIFAAIHLWAGKSSRMAPEAQSRLLSIGGGIATSYVFVDLLPKLSKGDAIVKNTLWNLFPYFERHVYVMALLGFLLFFTVDRSEKIIKNNSLFFWLSMSSYALFNFLVGYAVVDKNNPEVQPLILFTFAMALHYCTNDYSLSQAHGDDYRLFGKWVLIASLFLGWLVGAWTELSETAVALISAFIGGGVIMNVTRHELPEKKPNSLGAFLFGSFAYTFILLLLAAGKP